MRPSPAWTWTDATFGFEKLPGKTATVDGATHNVWIGPQGKPVWTVSTGKRRRPAFKTKLLPPEVDTIESAAAAIEKLYA